MEQPPQNDVQVMVPADSTTPDIAAIEQSFLPYSLCLSVRTFCLSVGALHGIVTFIFFIFALTTSDKPRIINPISQTVGAWVERNDSIGGAPNTGAFLDQDKCPLMDARRARVEDFFVQPVSLHYGTIDTRWVIVFFHALSCVFQIVSALPKDAYMKQLNDGKAELSHFVEYSFSASLMMLAMCAQLGVTDLSILLGVFCNTWACMVFGLLAEVFSESNTIEVLHVSIPMMGEKKLPYHWIAHLAGWVTLIFAFVCMASNLELYERCRGSDSRDVPWFVWWIVAGESIAFMSFGFVQFFSFLYKPHFTSGEPPKREHILWAYRCEYCYIWLSLIAKLWLGVFIYVGNYMVQ